MAARLA